MLCEHCHLPFLNVAHACSGRQGGRANPGANTACSTASSDSAGGQSRAHRQAPKSHNGTGRKQEAPHSSASGSSSTSSVQKPPISPNDQKSKTNKKKHNTSPPTPISDDIPAEEQWEDVHAEEDVVWVKNTAAMKLPSEVLDLCRSIPVEVAETCPQEMCLPPRTSKFQERMARITAAVIEDGVLRGRKLKEEEQQQQHSSMDRDGTLLLVLLPRIFLAKSPWSGDLERSKQLDAQHKRKELVNAQAKLERFLLDRVRTEEECWNTIKAALGEMKNWRNIEYKEGDTQSHHGKSLDAPQDSAIDMSQEDMLTEKMTQNGARAARLARQAEYSRAANLLDPNALQILSITPDNLGQLKELNPPPVPHRADTANLDQQEREGGDEKTASASPAGHPQPEPKRQPGNVLTEAEVWRAVMATHNLSAVGWSSWSKELLAPMRNFAVSKRAVTRLMSAIASGEMPEEMCPFMFGGKIVPLDKGAGKVRPIVVGDYLVKVAGKVLLDRIKVTLAQKFQKEDQYGVAVSGGMEFIIHATRTILEHEEQEGDKSKRNLAVGLLKRVQLDLSTTHPQSLGGRQVISIFVTLFLSTLSNHYRTWLYRRSEVAQTGCYHVR